MSRMRPVEVPRRPVAELQDVIGLKRVVRLLAASTHFRRLAGHRTIWTFSSTATGGGVAEILHALVGYTKDLAVDVRWYVIDADADFYRITKRLHNRIHGEPGDTGPLGAAERAHLDDVLAANIASVRDEIRPGDFVLLHDPQTAAMATPLARMGCHVVWRSHIGLDTYNDLAMEAWEFLRPSLADAEAYVFSRASYVPGFLSQTRTRIIAPSIDPFSPKNQEMTRATASAILTRLGMVSPPGRETGQPRFTRRDGGPGLVQRSATIVADAVPEVAEPVVVQVSRWDRLKDMAGVMRGFTEHIAPHGPGWLFLVGPAVHGVTDDPEGAAVYAQCQEQWRELPPRVRSRIVLATLPMDDIDENAAMVNALQRHARVIVQKSLAEGFGLTVAEGMWKSRPVVGSAVGGICDQITPTTGVLLDDPLDLPAFGRAVRALLDDPVRAADLGRTAHEHVVRHFVGDVQLLSYADLFAGLLGAPHSWRADSVDIR